MSYGCILGLCLFYVSMADSLSKHTDLFRGGEGGSFFELGTGGEVGFSSRCVNAPSGSGARDVPRLPGILTSSKTDNRGATPGHHKALATPGVAYHARTGGKPFNAHRFKNTGMVLTNGI